MTVLRNLLPWGFVGLLSPCSFAPLTGGGLPCFNAYFFTFFLESNNFSKPSFCPSGNRSSEKFPANFRSFPGTRPTASSRPNSLIAGNRIGYWGIRALAEVLKGNGAVTDWDLSGVPTLFSCFQCARLFVCAIYVRRYSWQRSWLVIASLLSLCSTSECIAIFSPIPTGFSNGF